MAVTFISLSDRIKEGDPKGFLLSYLQLVMAGKNLSLPTNEAYQDIKSAWEAILYGVPGGYPSSFLIQLSNYWMRIIQHVPPPVDETFAKRVLDFLNADEPVVDADEKASQSPPKPSKPVGKIQTKGGPLIDYLDHAQVDQKLTDTTTHLSAKSAGQLPITGVSAYDSIHTETVDFSEMSVTAQRLKASIHDEDVDQFLVYFLTQSLFQIKSTVPLSSMLDIIYHQWRDILMDEFNTVPSETFLKALSQRWYGLMTQMGLPSSREKVKALIYILKQGQSSEVKPMSSTQGVHTQGPHKKSSSLWQIFKKLVLGCLVVGVGLLSGCRDVPKVYRVPAEPLITEQTFMAGLTPSQLPIDNAPFTWKVPAHWVAQKFKSEFDRGLYHVDVDGTIVVVAITSMAGAPAQLPPNIARWRGQLGLPPASPAELNSSVTHLHLGRFEIDWVSLASETEGFEIAVLVYQGQNWFFKASGSPTAVKKIVLTLKDLITQMTLNASGGV